MTSCVKSSFHHWFLSLHHSENFMNCQPVLRFHQKLFQLFGSPDFWREDPNFLLEKEGCVLDIMVHLFCMEKPENTSLIPP